MAFKNTVKDVGQMIRGISNSKPDDALKNGKAGIQVYAMLLNRMRKSVACGAALLKVSKGIIDTCKGMVQIYDGAKELFDETNKLANNLASQYPDPTSIPEDVNE